METKYYIYIACGILIILFLIDVFTSRSRIYYWYNKFSEERNHTNTTGKEFAISAKQQLHLNIKLALIDGTLTDCYSPKSKTLMMSEAVCDFPSIASLAIIGHELGHAVQDHNKNPLFIITNWIRSLTNFTSKFILIFLFSAIIAMYLRSDVATTLLYISFALFGLHCLKNILLIPVEMGASNFALRYLKENKYLTLSELHKVKKLLRVASRTYIANFFDEIIFLKFATKKKNKRRKKWYIPFI